MDKSETIFSSKEQSEIELSFRAFNEKYEIFIDLAITDSPDSFPINEPNEENLVRFYISPTNNKSSISISNKMKRVIASSSINKLNNKILKKYIDKGEAAKGLIVASNSLVSHLKKRNLLKKRVQSQTVGYLIFSAMILIIIILIWVNHKSKNRMKLDDIWANAHQYGD